MATNVKRKKKAEVMEDEDVYKRQVMYSATIMAQMGPLGSPASAPKIMYRKGRAVMMEPPGAPGEATMATPRVMMNGTTVPRLMGS